MEISRPSLEERAAECARELTFSATVAYDGAPFAGFAKQPGQLTVQGELERALSLLFRRPVDVVCAGRTDAGVHARGQVVSFDIDACELRDRTPYNLRRSLNALTCEGIVVRAVEERPRGFSARFDAQWREYKYFLATGDTPPVFTDRTAWYVGPNLDIAAMERGATHLIGEHDFKSFCAVNAQVKTTVRTIYACSVTKADDIITIRVTGNGFLYNMVRIISGTLIKVGLGVYPPEHVKQILEACDRSQAGETVPAKGLFLKKIKYL